MNTSITKVYVGVDISKETLDIYLYPIDTAIKIKNTATAINDFIKKLSKYNVEEIACEATGGYEKQLDTRLKKAGYPLWIVDPKRIKSFIFASGCRIKNDRSDAQKIAKFASQNTRDYVAIAPTESQEQLRALVDRKNDLTAILAAEKTRLKQPSHERYAADIEDFIQILAQKIKVLDKQIAAFVSQDAELKKKSTFLESMPGIGKASAALLISHLPELGKINNAKISALVGLAPYDYESGAFKGKRRIRGGRMTPRNCLYMCAITAIKFNPAMKAFYDRLLESGKGFKVAIVAVMRKLIRLANTLLRKEELCNV